MRDLLKPSEGKFALLASLYAALFVLAPVISNRVVDVFGVKVLLGSVLLIVALGLLDVVNNDFGIRRARLVVVCALVTRIIVWVLVSALMALPVLSEPPGFGKVVNSSLALFLAGEISIFVSQYFVDVRIFDWVRRRYPAFWVRYSLSNLVSYVVGLVIFLVLAFWGKDVDLVGLFVGQIMVRLTLQALLMPFFSAISS